MLDADDASPIARRVAGSSLSASLTDSQERCSDYSNFENWDPRTSTAVDM